MVFVLLLMLCYYKRGGQRKIVVVRGRPAAPAAAPTAGIKRLFYGLVPKNGGKAAAPAKGPLVRPAIPSAPGKAGSSHTALPRPTVANKKASAAEAAAGTPRLMLVRKN